MSETWLLVLSVFVAVNVLWAIQDQRQIRRLEDRVMRLESREAVGRGEGEATS